MRSFLSQVVSEVLNTSETLIDTTFVLPNKRAGLFLSDLLKTEFQVTGILPRVISIEDLVTEISGCRILDRVNLLFEFYGIYRSLTPKNLVDDFEVFLKWAPVLIQDFNDLDSNLIDSFEIFSYLKDVKRLENWNLNEGDQSELVKNYLGFFERAHTYHQEFSSYLLNKSIGHQGLVYKVATEKVGLFCEKHFDKAFIFAGFNALNHTEEIIIQEFLLNDQCRVFWDNDVFYEQSDNQAGQFFSQYKNSWSYYNHHDFEWEGNNLNQSKTINLYGLPKNISQIKQVGAILNEQAKSGNIENTAVILGNEKLLGSLLNTLPEEIDQANITMGYGLQDLGINSFFLALFNLHINRANRKANKDLYYKDVLSLINDPVIKPLWQNSEEIQLNISNFFYVEKTIFCSSEDLIDLFQSSKETTPIFELLWNLPSANVNLIISGFVELIDLLRRYYSGNDLYQEFLFRYHSIFVQLLNLTHQFGYIKDVSNLQQVFNQILHLENMSFKGEPLQGLQIMGLLESRVLDFKNVIITSVNEGFLPKQGKQNSFIPNDIKLEKNIPTPFEKDAIFSYHFFRLLHRSEKIHIVYNNITDDFGSGEPSRFIKQLEISKEMNLLDKVKIIKHQIAPEVVSDPLTIKRVNKTDPIITKLKEVAARGLSPTSLSNLIRDPISFYKKSVLGLSDFEEMEETISSRTFGTIVHDTLYHLYKPFLNKTLKEPDLRKMIDLMDEEIDRQYKKNYSSHFSRTGKNLLSFEIAKQFVLNFLHFEISQIKKGHLITILGLEQKISYSYQVNDLDFPIKLIGTIDRIDRINGLTRIIDYKTGKVSQADLNIKDWEKLIQEEKYTKAFQVLCYAYMYSKNNLLEGEEQLESGIISFKNLKSGFIKFNKDIISDETLERFSEGLNELITNLFDLSVPFEEKKVTEYH